MILAAALGLLLAASETVGWEAAAETQERAREEPTADGRARYSELGLRAQLGLSAQGPDGRAALTYAPSFLFSQAISGPAEPGTAARQSGRLMLETRLDPTTRLGWRTSAEWGLTDFSPLSGQLARPVVGQLPSQRFVRTLGIDTMLELTHAFSRRVQLAVAGGMERGGGLGHDAVAALPIQVGPKANASGSGPDRLDYATLVRVAGALQHRSHYAVLGPAGRLDPPGLSANGLRRGGGPGLRPVFRD